MDKELLEARPRCRQYEEGIADGVQLGLVSLSDGQMGLVPSTVGSSLCIYGKHNIMNASMRNIHWTSMGQSGLI